MVEARAERIRLEQERLAEQKAIAEERRAKHQAQIDAIRKGIADWFDDLNQLTNAELFIILLAVPIIFEIYVVGLILFLLLRR
jgi:hypothetical protein